MENDGFFKNIFYLSKIELYIALFGNCGSISMKYNIFEKKWFSPLQMTKIGCSFFKISWFFDTKLLLLRPFGTRNLVFHLHGSLFLLGFLILGFKTPFFCHILRHVFFCQCHTTSGGNHDFQNVPLGRKWKRKIIISTLHRKNKSLQRLHFASKLYTCASF